MGEKIRVFNETCCVCRGRRGDDDNSRAKMWKEIENTKISLWIMWCAGHQFVNVIGVLVVVPRNL